MNQTISVVIATLGSESLIETIHSLNKGTVIPNEIIISIPEDNANNITFKLESNVKVIHSKNKGQVVQRCYGFSKTNSEFVLQLDDDVILAENCIEELIKTMQLLPKNSSVAPQLYLLNSGKFAYRIPTARDLYLGYWANGKNGYQPGKVSKSGINFGFKELNTFEAQEVDWLPGGCVLHRRENLILENYYPFKGKAFAEDLFHCMSLKRNGIQFFISPNSKIFFDWSHSDISSVWEDLVIFLKTSRALLKYAIEDNKNKVMLFFYLINYVLSAPFKNLFEKFK